MAEAVNEVCRLKRYTPMDGGPGNAEHKQCDIEYKFKEVL